MSTYFYYLKLFYILESIDSAQLYIQSDQYEPTDVYIVGLNLQSIRFANGMMGLAFSK